MKDFIKIVRLLLAAVCINRLTLPMLRLLLSKRPSKLCHVGIHWIVLILSDEYQGFSHFFRFSASFCIGKNKPLAT